jgi:hypothetical protein
MSIILTTPETRQSLTQADLYSFWINSRLKRAQMTFEVGYVDNGFVQVRQVGVLVSVAPSPGDPLNFEWDTFVNAIPEVRDLKQAVEQKAIALGVFDGLYQADA